MTKKRLAKFLSSSGVASRRKCEELIFAGQVRVNGKVELIPQTLVDENDVIECGGKKVLGEEKKLCYILNKPSGYICTASKTGKGKKVLDLFPEVSERLFTVGRLDKDTTGLLLVTNDGAFANKVIHPSSNIHKEYVLKAAQEITDSHLKAISSGTKVEGKHIIPAKVVKVRRGTVKIVVSEGKKREVRELATAAGLTVLELKRTRIGGLHLGDLQPGEWRAISEKEKEQIFE